MEKISQKPKFKVAIRQEVTVLIVFALLLVFFGTFSPYFFNFKNLITVALQTSVIGIIAVGMTFVIITGGIDLSVGAILALSGVVTATAIKSWGMPVPAAVICGLFTGLLAGFLNGVMVVSLELPPFIATLGTMMILRGVSLLITQGTPISGLGESFGKISGGYTFGIIPNPVMYFLIIALFFSWVLKATTLGKYIYAFGSNKDAARLSGLRTRFIETFAYSLNGVLCGVSGVILTSRLVSAQATEGLGYELDAIAAVVIGGASLSGGIGTVVGTIIGALMITTLRNGLNMLNVSNFWQQIAIGVVVLLAVSIDRIKNRKKL